jgi:hypothetical protein
LSRFEALPGSRKDTQFVSGTWEIDERQRAHQTLMLDAAVTRSLVVP